MVLQFAQGIKSMSGESDIPVYNEDNKSSSIMTAAENITSEDKCEIKKYIVEEEITVGIPLVRPSKPFLDVLRLAGAKTEIFTKKEICQYLKDYISARKLYDVTDPRIVYCDNDPLENVFKVKKFTINDVLDLIQKNVTSVPDTCIKRMRQMVCRTMIVTPPTNKTSTSIPKQTPGVPVSQTSFMIENCKTAPVITSTTSTLKSSAWKSPKQDNMTEVNENKRKHEASSDNGTEYPVRKRRTSLNVTYSDSETASYPWYFHVQMDTSDDSDKKNTDKKADSDDRWFVEEDTISLQYDSDAFSIEYDVETEDSNLSDSDGSSVPSGKDIFVMCNDSDVEFWADYSSTDIESDPEIPDSDKWTCEVCNERNTPRQAYCCKCWKMRPGWFSGKEKRRLNKPTRRTFKRSFSAPSEISSSESSDSYYHKRKVQKTSSSTLSSSDNVSPMCNKVRNNSIPTSLVKDDSGISLASCSTLPSSQERLVSSQESVNSTNVFQSPITQTFKEESKILKTCDIRGKSQKVKTETICRADKTETQSTKSSDKIKNSVSMDTDMCVVCLARPKTGSIIHGSSGHQVCCFKCAKQLKRKKKGCPVCRRPIQKVVRNYLL